MREISSTALYNRFTHNGCTWGASVHHPDPVARLPEMQYNPLSTRQATRKKEREKREPRDLDRPGEAGAKAALLCVTGWRPVALRKSRCAGGGGSGERKTEYFSAAARSRPAPLSFLALFRPRCEWVKIDRLLFAHTKVSAMSHREQAQLVCRRREWFAAQMTDHDTLHIFCTQRTLQKTT